MSYFLKKSYPSKKGLYLQIYESFYVPGKGKRNKSFRALGYYDDFINQGISDPIAHFQKEIDSLNLSSLKNTEQQISDVSTSYYLGHFLLKAMFDYLGMDGTINIVASNFKCRYMFSDLFKTLCYSQILSPGSKHKAFEKVIPSIYGANSYSYDQILDAIDFIGSDYHKYIEILNHHISLNWKRDLSKVFFDCTNYYFEIDFENDFLKKGPSKERRMDPLLGQALLLDRDQIPLDTKFYKGNESEMPLLRERIEEMKIKNDVKGRLIQVADKGLNCARNIYSAVIEANDGYIFSRSIKGKMCPREIREAIIDHGNVFSSWVSVKGKNGLLSYQYKVIAYHIGNNTYKDYGMYDYKCKIDPNDKKETQFQVPEKRILIYSPSLARKQRSEILRQVNKLRASLSVKNAAKEEYGDLAKYINVTATDNDGKKVKIASSINEEKVNEDLAFAGYNLLITSEIDADPRDIYNVYHNLWRIEESFKVMKSYLEARPVYLSNKNTIYGHFLLCYISLTILRLLELKTFNDDIPISQIIDFIRQYTVTLNKDGSYINTSTASETYFYIKEKLGITKLGNVYLKKKDIDNILATELD